MKNELADKMSPETKKALILWGRERRILKALLKLPDQTVMMLSDEAKKIMGRLEFQFRALPDVAESNRIAHKILSDQD